MYFARDTCVTAELGPLMTPFAELPNEPRVGAAKAPASNHDESVCWSDGRFGSRRIFGRMVTVAGVELVVNAVPVGSGPVHKGVRNIPVCSIVATLSSHPPNAVSAHRFALLSNHRPLPNGN